MNVLLILGIALIAVVPIMILICVIHYLIIKIRDLLFHKDKFIRIIGVVIITVIPGLILLYCGSKEFAMFIHNVGLPSLVMFAWLCMGKLGEPSTKPKSDKDATDSAIEKSDEKA